MKFSIYRKGSKDEIITIEYENGQNKWLLAITAAIESGANLTEANLIGANLTEANLIGANLTGANLYGANLYGADLTKANLTEANLTKANLTGANLTKANLTKANLTGADLDYCGFTFACKTFDIKADLRLAAQLAYHFCRLDFQDCEEAKQAQATLKELANKFHRVDECGEIGGAGEGC